MTNGPPKQVRIGDRFGRLTVRAIEPGGQGAGRQAVCICACGTEKTAPTRRLLKGLVLSCGCMRVPQLVTAYGVARSLEEWSILHGIPKKTISDRLRRGWPPERAVLEPSGPVPVGRPKRGSHVG